MAFSVCLSNGVPSEWTFRRVFTMIDPTALEALLRAHAAETVLQNRVIKLQLMAKRYEAASGRGASLFAFCERGVMKMALFWARSKPKDGATPKVL